MSKLVCIHGMNEGDEFFVNEGETVIGRSREGQIVLFDKKASRQHCQIIRKGDRYFIEDLDSRHGTVVNGHRIKKRMQISFGDKIRVAKTTLTLSEQEFGGILDRTAGDAAEDLEHGTYHDLLGDAADDVMKTAELRRLDFLEERRGGIMGFLRNLFRK